MSAVFEVKTMDNPADGGNSGVSVRLLEAVMRQNRRLRQKQKFEQEVNWFFDMNDGGMNNHSCGIELVMWGFLGHRCHTLGAMARPTVLPGHLRFNIGPKCKINAYR
jgi:hypothetical protein